MQGKGWFSFFLVCCHLLIILYYVCGGLVAKSCPTLVTPWTVSHQGSLSMGFPRQEYWRGLPFPSPGDLPYPGIKPRSPSLQAEALLSEPPGKPPFASYLPQLLNCGVGENS